MRHPQSLGQQRGAERRLQLTRDNGFDPGVVHFRLAPHAERRHAAQHFVARGLCDFRMTVRATLARRLRQHRQQCGFRFRQPRRGFTQIRPTGGLDALDGAAERCALEIQDQDVALRQMHFQLQRAQHLPQFSQRRARMPRALGVENACDLHRQRGTARHHLAAAQHLPTGTQQRHRIHAGMAPEPAVFVVEQRVQVQRGYRFRRCRIAPDAFGIGERTQRRAVACNHQRTGVARLRQLRRKDQIEQQQRGQQRDSAPAEPGQAAAVSQQSLAIHTLGSVRREMMSHERKKFCYPERQRSWRRDLLFALLTIQQNQIPPRATSSFGMTDIPDFGSSIPSYFGCTTVIVAGDDLPTPRSCGRYMSSTSDGGTV